MTPLMLAANCGQLEVVRDLLALGANRLLTLPNGNTATTIAAKKRHPDIVRMLVLS